MTLELSDREKLRALPWLIACAGAGSIFCQLTVFGSVFVLLLGELGLAKTQIGFLLSLFPFCGLLAPVVARRAARFGFKRTFIVFWSIRKFVVALLLLAPLVASRYGAGVTFGYVAGILLCFAICRAIAETAYYPWEQEVVPFAVRGKFSALAAIVSAGAAAIALPIAGAIIGGSVGVNRFLLPMAIGIGFGLLCIVFYLFIPGGRPLPASAADEEPPTQRYIGALRDRNLTLFLGGIGLATLGGAMLPFVPLFLRDEVGLRAGTIVSLQTATFAAGLLASYPWGWLADRVGGRLVLILSFALGVVVPLGYLAMSRHGAWSADAAGIIAAVYGVSSTGVSIGMMRLLCVSVVPLDKRTEYMATYYAWVGITGGIAPIVGGRLVDLCRGLSGHVAFFHLSPYAPLFALGVVLPLAAITLVRRVASDVATE